MQVNNLDDALKKPLLVNKLVLTNQQMTSIPAIIWRAFPNLEILDLSQNLIKTIPKAILKLKKLSRLNLSNNNIIRLPTTLSGLETLSSLDVSNNRIKEVRKIPPCIETLDISHNKLKLFPEHLKVCSLLSYLNLSHNKLEHIPDLSHFFPLLQYLNVSHNQLKEMGRMPEKLYALLISKNRLTKPAQNWSSLKNLQRLDISSNPIKLELAPNHQLQKLSYIDVKRTKTKWQNISYLIGQLPKLQMSLGGFTPIQQLRLSAFLDIISKNTVSLSNKKVFLILSHSVTIEINDQDLLNCLIKTSHPDLKVAAFNTFIDRYGHILRTSTKGRKFIIIGDVFSDKENLISRLQRLQFKYCEKIEEADFSILGHKNWPMESLKKTSASVSETQIIHWLDKKEKRYLTHLKDKHKTESIQRMLLSNDRATFDLGISLLSSWGTPKTLIIFLLEKWLKTGIDSRQEWESVLLPYLPNSTKIILSSQNKTRTLYVKGWEKTLWKLIHFHQH